MTTDKTKEGVVIDASPEPEESHAEPTGAPDTPPPEETADTPPAGKSGRALAGLALLLALIALGLVLAAGWYGYQQWQGLQTQLAAASDQGGSAASGVQQLRAELDKLQGSQQQQADALDKLTRTTDDATQAVAGIESAFTEQQQLMSSERALLDERETQLRTLVNNLHERVGRSGTQWLIAEADYLIKLADHRLRLAHDPATARAALEQADDRLRATGDPSWAGVREQLARDIAKLDTLDQPDITGLWARLGALMDQVPELSLNDDPRRVTRGDAPQLSLNESAEQERTWRTLLSDLWDGIKNAVRIRRHDEPVTAMLPPEQSYFLYENLRLTLQQARLALVQGRDDMFEQSLQDARDQLGTHFQADAVGRGLDAALAKLAATPISVDLPDLTDSLRVMQARRALLESQPAAPTPADGEAPGA